MPNLRQVRENLLIAYDAGILEDEEFLVLYDINKSTNPDLPYRIYSKFELFSLSEDECTTEFRFNRNDIPRLVEVLQIPCQITCYNGIVCDGTEALCILLKRLAYPCRYLDMIPRFGRPVPQLSMIAQYMINWVYEQWGHLLSNFTQDWLSQANLETFAETIHRNGAPLTNCWGFVDGTVRPVSRPNQHQRILYNGHKRVHALKFQSVVTPNGMIANMYGPVEGKRHDSGMLADSGLLNLLQQYSFDTNGNPLCIYGDPAYPLRVHLQMGFRGNNITAQQQEWNKCMSEVKSQRRVYFWRYHQLFQVCRF